MTKIPTITYMYTFGVQEMKNWEDFKLFLPKGKFNETVTANLLHQTINKYLEGLDIVKRKTTGVLIGERVKQTIPPDNALYKAMQEWCLYCPCIFIIGVNKTTSIPCLEVFCQPEDKRANNGYVLKGNEGKERFQMITYTPVD